MPITFISQPMASLPLRGRIKERGKALVVLTVCAVALCLLPFQAFAAEAPKEKIALGYTAISPVMAGVWMAKEIGAFEKRGLQVELIYLRAGPVVVAGLIGGTIHAALGASNSVVSAIVKGAPLIAVAGCTKYPAMVLWVRPEVQRPEQLEGQTIAVTRFGSTGDFVTRMILRKLDLEGKVKLRQFGGQIEADLGFRTRQADARVSSQKPTPDARQLVDAADLKIPFDMDFLAVSTDFYKRSFPTVDRIVRGYAEGMAALRADKPKALEVLAKYMRERGGLAEEHYQYVVRYLSPVPRVEPAAVETVLKMIGHTNVSGVKIYDNTIMDRLVQEGYPEGVKK
ncbi:MAG: ABC transporter substrate-binding protein [Deltaproteobacteria bacterium]|nr:ABC transporter substrate-binding protein [Deltaproteobacteria bacterium]